MYRIRLVSGDEAQYGSIDELGAAVAAGIVTDKAEIYHARAEKWLPIASHPHFKLAKDKVTGAATRPGRGDAEGDPPGRLDARRDLERLSTTRRRPVTRACTRSPSPSPPPRCP